MSAPSPRYLHQALDSVTDVHDGEVTESPRKLTRVDPELLGVAITSSDGRGFTAGDAQHEFSMQSISKALVYAMALQERGHDKVWETVGVEPSGEPYNAPSVDQTGRPDNPLINAGAMAVHGLLLGEEGNESTRIDAILETFSALAGRELSVDRDLLDQEIDNADANRSIAYMLRANDALPDDPESIVRGYSAQCSIMVTAVDLANMGATLAAGGTNPVTGKKIFDRAVVRETLSVMMTCGMYDASGDWVSRVGVPAKSGIGGGILGVIPGRCGVATFAPRLDEHGNSMRGLALFNRFADDLGFHFVDALNEDDHRWEDAFGR